MRTDVKGGERDATDRSIEPGRPISFRVKIRVNESRGEIAPRCIARHRSRTHNRGYADRSYVRRSSTLKYNAYYRERNCNSARAPSKEFFFPSFRTLSSSRRPDNARANNRLNLDRRARFPRRGTLPPFRPERNALGHVIAKKGRPR